MQTRVSSKGQVVLPGPIRRKLALKPGDELAVSVDKGRIVLTPRHPRAGKAVILVDSITGLPVLSAGPDAQPVTSEQVSEILSSFP